MFKKLISTSLIIFIVVFQLAVIAPKRAEAGSLQDALQSIAEKIKQANVKGAERTSDASSETNEQRLENAKKLVKIVIQAVRNWLDRHEEKLDNNSRFSDEDKETIRAIFNDAREWLDSVESDIDGATSVDEVKSIASDAKEVWNDYKAKIKIAYADIWISSGYDAIDRYNKVIDFLDNAIEKLKENGKDTSRLEDLLAQLRDEVQQSVDKLDQAIEHLEKMKEVTGKDAFEEFTTVATLVAGAIGNLMNDALSIFREVIDEIHSLL